MTTQVRAALDAKIKARPGPLSVQSRKQFLMGMPSPADEDAAKDAGYEDDPAMDKKKMPGCQTCSMKD